MEFPMYQVDAFTSKVFSGNPAAVCILDEWPDDRLLQSIGSENNLSETAFLVKNGDGFEIRWFTPTTEVTLCGHATLASAFVVLNLLGWQQESISFQSRKRGILTVTRNGEFLEMDFPAIPVVPQVMPKKLPDILSQTPVEIHGDNLYLLALMENESVVEELEPNFTLMEQLESQPVIVTAPGKECDFVSRFFAPAYGIPEDPVTGSAHCILIPYWSKRLNKKKLHARQLSKRGGELFCEDKGERVSISGKAVLYLKGTISI